MAKNNDSTLTFRYDEGLLAAFVFSGIALFAAYLFASSEVQNVMAGVLGLGDGIEIEQYRYDSPILYHIITWGTIFGFVSFWLAGFVIGGHPGARQWVISGQHLMTGKKALEALQEVEFNLMSQSQIERKLIMPPQAQSALPAGNPPLALPEGQSEEVADDIIPAAPVKPQPCRGIVIGGVEFSRTREVAHFFINGVPGAGKTVIIDNFIQQIIARQERLIVHCPKGDFTSWLPEEGLCLFGPWDSRSVWWDIAEDIRTPSLADSFAMALFPDGKSSDPFWSNAARELLAGVIKYIQRMYAPYCEYKPKWSWDTLTDALGQEPEKFIEMAQLGDPNVQKIMDQARKKAGDVSPKQEKSKTAQSIVSTLAANIGWIPVYASAFDLRRPDGQLRRDGFSISRWLKGDPSLPYRTLVLKNDANHKARGQQIFGALMACMSNYINSTAMPEISADLPGTWIILDEYPQLGAGLAAQVQTIEELGRSRGVRVVKAIQDEAQLYEQHGREKGRSQKSVEQTVIYAKTAKETANEVARLFGECETAEVDEQTGSGGRVVSHVRYGRKAAVRPEDLTGLRIRKGIPWTLLPWVGKKIWPYLKTGAEIVVSVDDVVVKLLQPFPERRPEIRPKVVESDKWNYGILEWAARIHMADFANEDSANEMKRIIDAVKNVGQKMDQAEATRQPFVFKGAAMMSSAEIAALAGKAVVSQVPEPREVPSVESQEAKPADDDQGDDVDQIIMQMKLKSKTEKAERANVRRVVIPGDNDDAFAGESDDAFDDVADADIRHD